MSMETKRLDCAYTLHDQDSEKGKFGIKESIPSSTVHINF